MRQVLHNSAKAPFTSVPSADLYLLVAHYRLREVLGVLEARAKMDEERAGRNSMAAVNVRNKVGQLQYLPKAGQPQCLRVATLGCLPSASAGHRGASLPSSWVQPPKSDRKPHTR